MSIYSKMYRPQISQEQPPLSNKAASRVLGGMKAAGVTSTIVEVDGTDMKIPRIEYVEALERQVKDLRKQLNDMTTKMIKMNNSINSIKDDLRQR